VRSDNLFIASLVMVAAACGSPTTQNISSKSDAISSDSLTLIPNKGLVYYLDEPFSGVSESYYPNDTLAEVLSYEKGVRHGLNKKYYSFGLLSYEALYVNGKMQGEEKSWWKNGNLRSLSRFEKGVPYSTQTEWYSSGQKFKEINLAVGKGEGMQTAWRQNGKIYNNYEAKNGRIFGLKRANLCYELKEEEVQYAD